MNITCACVTGALRRTGGSCTILFQTILYPSHSLWRDVILRLSRASEAPLTVFALHWLIVNFGVLFTEKKDHPFPSLFTARVIAKGPLKINKLVALLVTCVHFGGKPT